MRDPGGVAGGRGARGGDQRRCAGTDDPVVLASLWWQGYAYNVGGTALACWLLTGVAPDVRAERMAVGIAGRPSSVVAARPRPRPTPAS